MIVFIADTLVGDGEDLPTAYRGMAFNTFHPLIYKDEVGHNPPIDPNICVVMMEVDSLDPILNHPDYGEGAILYDEPNPYPKNEKPSAAAWGQLRSHLAKLKMKQAEINAAIGNNVNGRTRKEIADALTNWLRNR